MKDRGLRDLENVEQWDLENAEMHAPAKSARVVVSVSFPRSTFDRVAQRAEQLGLRTSEFIREAAIEKAASPEPAQVISFSGTLTGGLVINGARTSGPLGQTRLGGTAQAEHVVVFRGGQPNEQAAEALTS